MCSKSRSVVAVLAVLLLALSACRLIERADRAQGSTSTPEHADLPKRVWLRPVGVRRGEHHGEGMLVLELPGVGGKRQYGKTQDRQQHRGVTHGSAPFRES